MNTNKTKCPCKNNEWLLYRGVNRTKYNNVERQLFYYQAGCVENAILFNATPSMFAFPDTSSKLTLCRNFMKYSSPNYPSVVSCFKFTTQNHNANTPINYLAQSMFSMFS